MKNETLKNETPADVKPVLANGYFLRWSILKWGKSQKLHL